MCNVYHTTLQWALTELLMGDSRVMPAGDYPAGIFLLYFNKLLFRRRLLCSRFLTLDRSARSLGSTTGAFGTRIHCPAPVPVTQRYHASYLRPRLPPTTIVRAPGPLQYLRAPACPYHSAPWASPLPPSSYPIPNRA